MNYNACASVLGAECGGPAIGAWPTTPGGRLVPHKGGGGGNVFESQQRIIDALAGGDMTKKEAVRQGYLYDALISMDESLRQREEQKQHT